MIESLKKKEAPLLVLDCGGIVGFTPRDAEKKADAAIEAMTRMGYQGMNLGPSDFTLGTAYLKKAAARAGFPLISTNTVVTAPGIPRPKAYEIVAVGGLRIAVLGVLPPGALDWAGAFQKPDAVKIEDPEKALRAALPAVLKEKPDAVVLLSQLDYEPTAALAAAIPEITVAVSCGMRSGCADDSASSVFLTTDGKALPTEDGAIHPDDGAGGENSGERTAKVLYVGSKGKDLGIISMSFTRDGKVSFGRETLKRLDDAVPEDPAVRGIVNQVFYRKPASRKTGPVDPKSHEELMKGLQQSPEAFMEQYRKTHKDEVMFPPEIFQQKSASGRTTEKEDVPEEGGVE